MRLFRDEINLSDNARLHGEIVLNRSISSSLLVAALCFIVAVVCAWLTLGTFARIETVDGILATERPVAKVVASEAGLVRELLVHEGQQVRQGDRIAVIRLDRQGLSGSDLAASGGEAAQARKGLALSQAQVSQERVQAERERLLEQIATDQRQVSGLNEKIALQAQVVASNQGIFDQIETVVQRGFVSKVEYERRHQALLNARQALADLKQQVVIRSGSAAQARAQLAGLNAEARQAVLDGQSNVLAISQQQLQLEGQEGYVITAPISGRITALQTGVGRSASPAVPLLSIVPDGTVVKAELYAPSRAVGMVKPGQETRLLFDAFPYERFGSFGGRIESVSRAIIDPRETEVPLKLEGPVYKVVVALNEQTVAAADGAIALQPGMTLKANIVLERQSFLQWLLRPLNTITRRTS